MYEYYFDPVITVETVITGIAFISMIAVLVYNFVKVKSMGKTQIEKDIIWRTNIENMINGLEKALDRNTASIESFTGHVMEHAKSINALEFEIREVKSDLKTAFKRYDELRDRVGELEKRRL